VLISEKNPVLSLLFFNLFFVTLLSLHSQSHLIILFTLFPSSSLPLLSYLQLLALPTFHFRPLAASPTPPTTYSNPPLLSPPYPNLLIPPHLTLTFLSHPTIPFFSLPIPSYTLLSLFIPSYHLLPLPISSYLLSPPISYPLLSPPISLHFSQEFFLFSKTP
jgi:hypothetical protein